MTPGLRRTLHTGYLFAITTAAFASLSGCPTGPIPGSDTVLTIQNQFSQFNITNIRLIGPGDTLPSENVLSGAVPSGTGVEIALTAPDRETNPEGVVWTAIVVGQLQTRAKQSTPNEIRPALNADFNNLDTDDNNALTLAEVQAGYPDFTQFNLYVFDRDNSGTIELNETGALLRFATATFTCVHDGDQIVWNFDGASPADTCADAP